MEIPLKKIGFGLLFLVAVLVLVNIFFIMPFLSLEPVQIPTILEEAAERAGSDSVVLRVDSLSVIRKNGVGEGAFPVYSDDQSLRNPFFWPEEKSQPEKIKETEAVKPEADKSAADRQEPPKPRLSMVLISEGGKQALLDDVFIREGDMFHDYLVKSIQDNEVVLSNNFGDFHIILGSGEQTEEPSLPPGGVIER